jgi:tetratricopeptide (TPR) repeat protein
VSKILKIKLMKNICILFVLLFSAGSLSFGQDITTAKNLSLSQRFEDANNIYKALIEKEPTNGDVYFYYGVNILDEYITDPFSNSKASTAKDAKGIFKSGIEKDSINPLNYIGLGMVALFEKGDTISANANFAVAEKTIPKKAKNYTPKSIETLLKLATAELYSDNPRFTRALHFAGLANTASPNNPDVFIALGDINLANKQASVAITNYNRALYIEPNNVLLMVKIGNIYIRAKNLVESRNYFEKAKAIDSTFAPLYKGLGEAYSSAGQYKFAKINYKKFLDYSGNNIPAKVSYINSLFKAKDYTEALNQIEEVQKIDNSRNYLNRVGAYSAYDKKPADYNKALEYIEAFFANTTPDRIITRDYTYYGRTLLKLKKDSLQIDKGFEMLRTAYDMDTTDMDVVDDLAVNGYFLNRFPIAIEMLKKKIYNGVASTNDYMYLGRTYYKMGDYGKADTVFTTVTQKDPDYLQAYVWIANSYASLDPESKEGLAKPKYEMVIQKALADTVKNSKELFDAYSYMGSYYLFTAKPDYDQSESYYQKIINLDPTNKKWQSKAYKSMGIIYTRRKDYAKAIAQYKKALVLDPSDTDSVKAIEGLTKAVDAQKESN